MTIDLRRAMRAATALVREQDLAGATKAIQQALAHPKASGLIPDEENHVSPGAQGNTKESLNHALAPATTMRSSGRLQLPLGDVIKVLRVAKLNHAWRNKGGDAVGAPKLPEGASFLSHTFSGSVGSREFKLYIPASKGPRPPLLIMLHGCTQDADDFAAGTRMNQLAEESGFLVAYPIQPRIQNPSGCWNWFRPSDQKRGLGEPSILAGITGQVSDKYDVNPERVFIAGLSAGGAMAAVMAATYPDRFSGVGIHSGLPCGAAADVVSAFAAMRGEITPRKSKSSSTVPTIVFHGDADKTVNLVNAHRIVDAISPDPTHPGHTSIGEVKGRRFTRRCSQTVTGRPFEHWTIHGAGHAWSGGCGSGSFADETGPDASREMVRFFKLSGAS